MPAHLKDASVRRRANKATTRAVLSADHNVKAPMLPKGIEWLPATKRWWRDLWKSEMATEYIQMDINGLFRVALLYNEFWHPDTELKQRLEIQVRLEKADADYGTNPLARRRLEWQIEETEDKQAKGTRRRGSADDPPAADTPSADADPRLKLA